MKNFTNNFKQFTSRLSARWLIMALMLLLGTSSAWADHIQNTGSMCLKYWPGSGSDIWTSAIDLGKTLNLGDISGTPYIKAAWVKTQGGTSINYLKIVIYIDGVYKGDYGVNYSGNSSYWDRTFEGSFDIAFNTTPGEHTIEIKAEPNNATHGSTYVKYNVPGAVDPCIPKFYLAGTFPGLSWTAGESGGQEMVCNDGVHTKTYKNVTLEAKKYEYKVTGVNGWGDNEFPSSGNSEYTVGSAGNYDVTFTYVPNTSLSVSLKSACSAPSSVSIDGVPSTNPCPGTEVTLEANVGEGDVESYSWSVSGTDWSIMNNTNTNQNCTFIAGTETGNISLTVSGCSSSDDATTSIDVKSRASKSDITVSNNEYTYDGTVKAATVKWIDTDNSEGITVTAPTNVKDAGSYTIKVTTSEHGDLCASNGDITLDTKLTISEKTPDENDFVYTDQTVTYNGEEQSVDVEWKDGYEKTGAITVLYNGKSKKPTNVGIYTISVTSAASDNFNETTLAIEKGTLIINCAQITDVENNFVLSNTSYNYGEPAKPTVSLKQNSTLVQAGLGAITTKYYNSSDQEVANPTAVGTYTVKITMTEGNGYSAITEPTLVGTFTITCPVPAQPQLTIAEGEKVKVCEGKPNTDGYITISNFNSYSDCKLYLGSIDNEKEIKSNKIAVNTAGTYTIIVENACGESSENSIAIEEEILTPTLTSITIEPNTDKVCAGDNNVTLTCNLVGAVGTPTYKWTKNGEPVGDNSNTIEAGVLERNTTFSVSVILDNSGCTKEFTVSKELEVKVRPEAPNLGSTGETICFGTKVNLPMIDKNDNNNQINWYNGNKVNPTNLSVSETTTFYAEAVSENGLGCPSNDKTPYTVTVNALPTITEISGNNSAVLYEDVVLTATGVTQGAEVKWYLDNDVTPVATGTTYIVTSENAGKVTVKAKAFLGDCESDFKEHEVTFDAEDCTQTEDEKTIEIWCRMSDNSNGSSIKCYGFGAGNFFGSYPGSTANNGTGTYESKTYQKWIYTFDSKKSGLKVIFNTQGDTDKTGDISVGSSGKRYYYWYNKSSKEYGLDDSETIYTPKPITAPAVKTVSANSEQGSGVVNFTGQIIKTGCAATSNIYYGYQFKKADEEWPTTGVDASNTPVKGKLIPLTNASETALYYQFSADVENLEDGDYHFRAYIINGYNFTNGNYDQGVYYGLDKLVTVSTVQTPVTTATIQLTDANGTPVANDKKYCVGETGYIKVTSDVKYTTIQWETDKGTEIDVNGNNGIYSFVAKGDDNIWVMLSNRHNNPESPAINENPLVINTFADPILPRVSLNKVSICSNDEVGATVKLTNVVKGQTYQLYQQIENAGGSFTEQAIGDAKTQTEEVTDKTELVLHTLNNTYTTGKYFVKTYTSDCEDNKVATQPFTFTVVDAAEVFISIEPTSAETTPWMPAKFTVNASDKYTLNVTKGNPAEPATEVEVNQNDNKVSVKIPLPEGTQHATGQYQNVTFPQGATTQYTITATLSAAGGDNPCAAPTSATITLVPYVEECTIGH